MQNFKACELCAFESVVCPLTDNHRYTARLHLHFAPQTEQERPSSQEALVSHRLGPRHAAGEQRNERHLSQGK